MATCYYRRPYGTIWKKLFFKNYFKEEKVSIIRREILAKNNGKIKVIHTYCERFKKLPVRWLGNGISDYHLYQCLCEGLIPMDWRIMKALSSGSLADMTLTEIRASIEKMAIKSKHLTNEEEWYLDPLSRVKEINNTHLNL